jgi:hypothetical protein
MGELQTIAVAFSAFVGGLAGVASLTWWLSRQFQAVKDSVLIKLEEHERLDNERFQNQSIAIMRIEMALQGEGKSLHRI